MVEAKLSERAQKIITWIGDTKEIPIRQQTLAEEFGCSRRTIGRALKELKEAGLLVDLNKRHENRCKLYKVSSLRGGVADVAIQPSSGLLRSTRNDKPTPQGEQQLKLYRPTFEVNFRDWPDWEKYYPQVTWELRHETDMHLLWRKTFDRLYMIRDNKRETGFEPATLSLGSLRSTN